MEMDRQDEHSGRLKEIHQMLRSAYCQFQSSSSNSPNDRELQELNEYLRSTFCTFKSNSHHNSPTSGQIDQVKNEDDRELQDADDIIPGDLPITPLHMMFSLNDP